MSFENVIFGFVKRIFDNSGSYKICKKIKNMVFFTIAGKPECEEFVHSVYVANYLEQHLPDFKVTKIQKISGEFEPWLLQMCESYNWFHYKSPIIWREVSMRGGRPHLIGGINAFWEHICHYYGIASFLSAEDIETITDENMKFYEKQAVEENEIDKNTRHLIITGACNPMVVLLLPELLTVNQLPLKCGIKVYLHDFRNNVESEDSDVGCDFLYDIVEDMKDIMNVSVITNMRDVLPICDLLLIVDDVCKRQKNEIFHDWLIRSLYYSYQLSDEINPHAKKDLRIVIANDGPRCFMAMAMIQACPRIRGYNILAITSDVGLNYLDMLSTMGNYPVCEMGAPPVWGFCGNNEFVDVRSVVARFDMLLPYKRATTMSESSLPLGHVVTELRYAGYLVEDTDEIKIGVESRKQKIEELLDRYPAHSKVRSIISFLKLWYANEPHANEIISLGVKSNGSFGIPYGLIFSQPSKYTEGRWLPYENFPISKSAQQHIQKILPEVLEILEKFDFVLERQLLQLDKESGSDLVNIYTYDNEILPEG